MHQASVLAVLCLLIAAAASHGSPAIAQPVLAQRAVIQPVVIQSVVAKPAPPVTIKPMRVVVVRADLPDCGAACPRWISAEGMITAATPEEFRRVFRAIGASDLPLFIRSPGGVVEAALDIGRMLRQRHMTVTVTGTRFIGCRPSDETCPPPAPDGAYIGMPITNGSTCASACAFLIAGGDTRLVSSRGRVGVHRMSMSSTLTVQRYRIDYREENGRRVEVGRSLVEEHQVQRLRQPTTPTRAMDERVTRYLEEMGVTDLPLTLGNNVAATAIRWLTPDELAASRLANGSTDGADLVQAPSASPPTTRPPP